MAGGGAGYQLACRLHADAFGSDEPTDLCLAILARLDSASEGIFCTAVRIMNSVCVLDGSGLVGVLSLIS